MIRLAGSRGPYPYNHGKHLKVFVDLFVYADETGTQQGAPLCMVAGHIASPRQWDKFNVAWRAVLASEGVPEFHAHDFFQGARWRSTRSPYHGWTVAHAIQFLAQLTEIIGRYRLVPVGCGVQVLDFRAEDEGLRRLPTGAQGLAIFHPDGSVGSRMTGGVPTRPYQSAWLTLIFDALVHAKPDATVHFYFDEQHEYEPFARKDFAAMRKRLPAEWAKRLGGLS